MSAGEIKSLELRIIFLNWLRSTTNPTKEFVAPFSPIYGILLTLSLDLFSPNKTLVIDKIPLRLVLSRSSDTVVLKTGLARLNLFFFLGHDSTGPLTIIGYSQESMPFLGDMGQQPFQ